tara:strand:- start:203 stop:418 length:216 start_codon:yes stop_codon:yes gene_type:complete
MDNNKFIQFLKQIYADKTPSELHWFAKVDENDEIVEITVQDKIFNDRYNANPSDYSDIKPCTETSKIGDTL